MCTEPFFKELHFCDSQPDGDYVTPQTLRFQLRVLGEYPARNLILAAELLRYFTCSAQTSFPSINIHSIFPVHSISSNAFTTAAKSDFRVLTQKRQGLGKAEVKSASRPTNSSTGGT